MSEFWRHPPPLPWATDAEFSIPNETTTQAREDEQPASTGLFVDAETVRAFVADMASVKYLHDFSCAGRVCLNPEHADVDAPVIDVPVIAYGGVPSRDLGLLGALTTLRKDRK